MKTKTGKLAATSLAILIGPVAASAAPSKDPTSGQYYEVIAANSIPWDDAAEDASNLTLNIDAVGLRGHLATITSSTEDAFIHSIRTTAGLTRPETWVGGYQAAGSGEPGLGWAWINGEGVIPPAPNASPYANWLPGEPNNLNGNESHLTVGLGNAQGWNDEGALGNIGGYVVEYRIVAQANDDGPIEVSSGVLRNIDVLDNDYIEAAIASVTIESQPASGGNSIAEVRADFTIDYTSDTSVQGQDSFSYRVTDVNGVFSIATVTLDVSATEASVDIGEDQVIFNQAKDPSPDSNNPMTAAYKQVLDGGTVTISCCRVLDTREGAGRRGSYLPTTLDLGVALDDPQNPTCADMPSVAQGTAVLRPWQRGVPKSKGIIDVSDPPPADVREHDLGVCLIEADVESRGVVFSAEEAKNVLGYSLNGAVKTLKYRPFTGGVTLAPDEEEDAPYVAPWTAEWDESRSGKRYSDNVMIVNLWHDWFLMPSVPYLYQLATVLEDSIDQYRSANCSIGSGNFLDELEAHVKSAKRNILTAILPWLRVREGRKAVDTLDDATRLALLIGPDAPSGDPYDMCPGNPEGLFVGRLMSLKFAACSELVHPLSSASSLDGACVIEEDILCELPELPGFPHPASCATPQ